MPPYKFSIDIEVRFRDLDALGHVNNAVYLTYFEVARMHYWRDLFGRNAFEDFSYILVRSECNYRSPAHHGDHLKVSAKVSALKNSSFIFDYEVTNLQSGRLIADGQTIQAWLDQKEKKTSPIPQEIRMRITDFEGEP